ncbi:MAG TPA: 7,8-didemethyl-8-hydroxy-5-deazariboflavin synthase CofG [Chloroflexota bacterium]|nr:7,8-didemethyl-8-hydroxy-5-deazariboflavin synthase CofG [Chloroflexota bacterium]
MPSAATRRLPDRPPTRDEAVALLDATGGELDALLAAAAELRDAGKDRVVTYSRKVFIPLTNLCRDSCGYCTFVRRPGDPRARTLTPDDVLAIARAGAAAGCHEALFSLGDKPERRHPEHGAWLAARGYATTIDYLAAMCRLVLDETGLLPHANPGALSAADLALLRPTNVSMGMMLESTSERLLARGQAHWASPDKVPAVRLATLRAAGEQRVAFTTGILIGIGETLAERVDALLAIRDVHAEYGHIQEIIVQNFRAKPDIALHDWPEPDEVDMARTIAVARLLLGPAMNIQAPPNLTPGKYPLYLAAGANDWGGVSPVTIDHINPEAPWPEIVALEQATAAAGYMLRERLALYPEYARDRPEFIPESLRARVANLTDDDGLVPRRGGAPGVSPDSPFVSGVQGTIPGRGVGVSPHHPSSLEDQ